MISVFIFALLFIADIQLFMLYRDKMDHFEKTKDESLLKTAKRFYVGAACSVIATLAFTVFMAVRPVEGILSF